MSDNSTALDLVPSDPTELVINRAPDIILAEAHRAAQALTVVLAKKKPVIFNGERYLEFEDWQTIGRFYGVTAKVTRTTFVHYDFDDANVRGFVAEAVAQRVDGFVLSSCESACLTDESKWRTRRTKNGNEAVPLFQLMSMAQTRACSKVLRNVFAWVIVLAGYRPTPVEEIDDPDEPVRDVRDDAPRPRGPQTTSSTPLAAPRPVPPSARPVAASPPERSSTTARPVGTIVSITDVESLSGPGVLVKLSTGFIAGTKHPDLISAAKVLHDTRVPVELITREAAVGKAPTILELRSVEDREPGADDR